MKATYKNDDGVTVVIADNNEEKAVLLDRFAQKVSDGEVKVLVTMPDDYPKTGMANPEVKAHYDAMEAEQ